jgi:hypothetical protein
VGGGVCVGGWGAPPPPLLVSSCNHRGFVGSELCPKLGTDETSVATGRHHLVPNGVGPVSIFLVSLSLPSTFIIV